MKKMLCAALLAILAVSAAPVFAAVGSPSDDAENVQRYNCCGSRCYRDDDQSGPYCDENGYCTYDRR
ncbi:conotoxin LiCr95 [uncultured Selenomonas sp.]|jgi:hypothetical protein|uniref:conotoxin LiCr95 n=1 Tax=uncultured Selenomonas sp. TaxID=159275 RepID=UPI00262CC65D|nr:conotoxin LiCr95 [uncultured Selenomonas sp.]